MQNSQRPSMKPCLLAFMDVLGSKRIFEGSEERITQYISSLHDIRDAMRDRTPDLKIMGFSDNIMLFTHDCSPASFDTMMGSIADIQLYCLIDHRVLFRGGVSNKAMHTSEDLSIGHGLIEAYELETKHAKTPRVIISSDIKHDSKFLSECKDDGWSFINYLEHTIEDGFPIEQRIIDHRNGIIHLINEFNQDDGMNLTVRDESGAKYLWLIKYHNLFCDEYDIPYEIKYRVKRESGKMIISTKEGS